MLIDVLLNFLKLIIFKITFIIKLYFKLKGKIKMLNLKIEQFYSDNEGNKWLFCRYDTTNKGYISYVFYSSEYNIKHFNQYCDDVLYCNILNSRIYIRVNDPDAWIISKEYDAIDLNKK